MLYTHAAAAIAGAVLAGVVAWNVQSWRWDAKYQTLQQQYTQSQIDAEAAKRKAEDDYNARYTKALNDARKREANLRSAMAAAGRESDGLREQLSTANQQLASASESAVRRYASTIGDVLAECADRYTSMAATADRRADEVRTLIEAWPQH